MPARLLLCGFGAFPGAPRNPAQAAVEALAAQAWSPRGVVTDHLILPVAWRGSAEAALLRLGQAPAQAVLVVGVAVGADVFQVEQCCRNTAAAGRPDHLGEVWPQVPIRPGGADELRASAPCGEILAALEHAGLPAKLSEDAGDYLCNLVLYRLLEAAAAPVVGFLHVPQVREFDPGAAFALADVVAAVKAAGSAMARAIRPAASRHRA